MKILCFGDSNTYGYDPRGYIADRYPTPWPELIADRTGWDVVNAGLCGREIPGKGHALPVFAEYDCILLMLGTNDLLQGASARKATARMEAFLTSLLPCCNGIVLVAPPAMERGVWVVSDALREESAKLSEAYWLLAQKLPISFVGTQSWQIPLAYDGVHFTEDGHRIFADRMIQTLTDIGEKP